MDATYVKKRVASASLSGEFPKLGKLMDDAENDVLGLVTFAREQRVTRMVMQVHDELVFEVPEAKLDWARSEVPRLMTGVAELSVPQLAALSLQFD